MSYNRTTATEYLNSEFAELAADAGIALSEVGWKTVLDKVFRSSFTEDDQQEALLDVAALERLSKALAPRVSISKSTAGTSAQRSANQAFAQVTELLKLARDKCKDLGLLGGSTWSYGYLGEDRTEASDY